MSDDGCIAIGNASTKCYVVPAVYEWAIDNSFTPQLLVYTNIDGVDVPDQYVKDDRIVLNIHPQSVQSLEISDEYIFFSARFSGSSHDVTVPLTAVMGIYARENGQGVFFQEEGDDDITLESTSAAPVDKKPRQSSSPNRKKTSHLKLVK